MYERVRQAKKTKAVEGNISPVKFERRKKQSPADVPTVNNLSSTEGQFPGGCRLPV